MKNNSDKISIMLDSRLQILKREIEDNEHLENKENRTRIFG